MKRRQIYYCRSDVTGTRQGIESKKNNIWQFLISWNHLQLMQHSELFVTSFDTSIFNLTPVFINYTYVPNKNKLNIYEKNVPQKQIIKVFSWIHSNHGLSLLNLSYANHSMEGMLSLSFLLYINLRTPITLASQRIEVS